ncbi:MAG: tRNA pseudouridine(55) synthase TruB [Spirochaetaceae bacterium]|jgi:tRNA pseudouridine55 synthase|nr:tRNA pseudouridine(55) synthase TruB [Spirochaetaceae bacterium]
MNSCYLLLNKPAGRTSFEALHPVKQIIKSGKAGHTGTLDKFASGLLLVLTGGALKLSSYLTHADKQYEGTVYFGCETDTLDPEGVTVAVTPPPGRDELEAVLPRFLGNIMQVPPEYSAIHINGKRAHEIARSGGVVKMQSRPVMIYRLELNDYTPPLAHITVFCSSGTYIRSLARDIARAAGSCGHLSELKRTHVGQFSLDNAAAGDSECEIRAGLRPLSESFFTKLKIPLLRTTVPGVHALRQGKSLPNILKDMDFPVSPPSAGPYAVFHENDFVALLRQEHGRWTYGFVLSGNDQ